MDEPKEAWIVERCQAGMEHTGPWVANWVTAMATYEDAKTLSDERTGEAPKYYSYRPRRYVPAEE